MQKEQKTEDSTCPELGPGKLGAQMQMHNSLIASFF
jgi:hypothetical protein